MKIHHHRKFSLFCSVRQCPQQILSPKQNFLHTEFHLNSKIQFKQAHFLFISTFDYHLWVDIQI